MTNSEARKRAQERAGVGERVAVDHAARIAEAHPTTKVARDLREIDTLFEALMVQAIHRASDRLMPGGEAMVARAGAGSPAQYAENINSAEQAHLESCPKLDHTRCRYVEHVLDEDDAEPPLQTLLFWSEAWRAAAGYGLDRTPTIVTETRYIRSCLNWAWENEAGWDDFAKDVRRAKTRMENLLLAGARPERGAPCLYESCGGARIIRKLVPKRGDDGEKIWDYSDWHCPRCKRSWPDDRYRAMVTAAHERTKFEEISGEIWCTTEWAARKVNRSEATIRQWLHKGLLATACIVAGRRTRFVLLGDVVAQDQRAKRRGGATAA